MATSLHISTSFATLLSPITTPQDLFDVTTVNISSPGNEACNMATVELEWRINILYCQYIK